MSGANEPQPRATHAAWAAFRAWILLILAIAGVTLLSILWVGAATSLVQPATDGGHPPQLLPAWGLVSVLGCGMLWILGEAFFTCLQRFGIALSLRKFDISATGFTYALPGDYPERWTRLCREAPRRDLRLPLLEGTIAWNQVTSAALVDRHDRGDTLRIECRDGEPVELDLRYFDRPPAKTLEALVASSGGVLESALSRASGSPPQAAIHDFDLDQKHSVRVVDGRGFSTALGWAFWMVGTYALMMAVGYLPATFQAVTWAHAPFAGASIGNVAFASSCAWLLLAACSWQHREALGPARGVDWDGRSLTLYGASTSLFGTLQGGIFFRDPLAPQEISWEAVQAVEIPDSPAGDPPSLHLSLLKRSRITLDLEGTSVPREALLRDLQAAFAASQGAAAKSPLSDLGTENRRAGLLVLSRLAWSGVLAFVLAFLRGYGYTLGKISLGTPYAWSVLGYLIAGLTFSFVTALWAKNQASTQGTGAANHVSSILKVVVAVVVTLGFLAAFLQPLLASVVLWFQSQKLDPNREQWLGYELARQLRSAQDLNTNALLGENKNPFLGKEVNVTGEIEKIAPGLVLLQGEYKACGKRPSRLRIQMSGPTPKGVTGGFSVRIQATITGFNPEKCEATLTKGRFL